MRLSVGREFDRSSSVRMLPEPKGAFAVYGTVLFVFAYLILLAGSQAVPMYFLTAAMIGMAYFASVFIMGRGPADWLFVALIFFTTFNALYLPVFGFFAALHGGPVEIIYKFSLGLRSVAFTVWIFCIAVFLFVRNGVSSKSLYFSLVAYFLAIFLSFVISSAPISARFTYLLNSFLPVGLTFYFVNALFRKEFVSYKWINACVVSMLFLLAVGCIYFPLLSLSYDIFRPDFASVFRARPGEYVGYGEFDPSWGTQIFGYTFNRFVGTFPDPIIFGYFVASMAFALFVSRRWLGFAFCIFLLLISLSKGAWLFLLFSFLLWRIGLERIKIFVFILILLIVVQVFLAGFVEASNKMHFLGLVGGLKSVLFASPRFMLFGYGIGDGGNLGRAAAEGGALGAGWLGTGSESGVGILVHQMGLMGLFGYISLAFCYIISLKSTLLRMVNLSRQINACAALLASLFINSFLQENCVNASLLASVLLSCLIIMGVSGRVQINNSGNSIGSKGHA